MIGKAAALAAVAAAGAVTVEVSGGPDTVRLALQLVCGGILVPVAAVLTVRRWPSDPVRPVATLEAVPTASAEPVNEPAGNAVVLALPAGKSSMAA